MNPKNLARRVVRRLGYTVEKARREPPPVGLESFSQQGEDMILNCLFQHQQTGFYIDVGAHHPTRFSNTYFFYRKGWRGINVDAMPGSMRAFRDVRPEDINLECGVAAAPGTLTYYEFDEPAVNGFSRELSEARNAQGQFRLVRTHEIPTMPLAEILEAYLPEGQPIDLLSIDVEGLDLEVLKSNDWSRYRPKVVVAEDCDALLVENLERSEVASYLRDVGYKVCGKCVHSVIFADQTRLAETPDQFFRDDDAVDLAKASSS